MNKADRSRHYQDRVRKALQRPRLQDTLHRFADAYVIARENAFAGQDFEALRTAIGTMKDEVRDNMPRYRSSPMPKQRGRRFTWPARPMRPMPTSATWPKSAGSRRLSRARAWRARRLT